MREKGFAPILILLGGLILAGLAGGAYYFGKINFSPQPLSQPHTTQSSSPIASPSPSATLLVWPSPVVTSAPIKIPGWKTYLSDDTKFSIEYPPSLSVQKNTYGNCPSFSDISNPQMQSADFMKQGHSWIVVCVSSEDMPSTFSYSDTATEPKNTTIKPYTVNGYSGIRGKTIYYLPGLEGDEVYLQNPVGGYASFDLRAGDVQIYDKMLLTFKFIDRNQGRVKIIQGNVYFLSADGKPKLIANPKDIKEQGGLFAFTDALLSPDHSKIRLLGQGGISSELLYYTRLNNISVKNISTAEEAVWSPNSRYIAYNSKVAGESYT